MYNILLAGVGGQGTVLAAKILATAAQEKGWQVRTAETIGMAQRGGSVVSHVRIGDKGESVASPLVGRGTADMLIAFEPAEAVRALPYLADGGVVVCATSAVQAVTTALSGRAYNPADMVAVLEARATCDPSSGASLASGASSNCDGGSVASIGHLVVVDDAALLSQVGSARALNTVLLAAAVGTGLAPVDVEELKAAIALCVKPKFVELNVRAVDIVCGK